MSGFHEAKGIHGRKKAGVRLTKGESGRRKLFVTSIHDVRNDLEVTRSLMFERDPTLSRLIKTISVCAK